MMGRSDAWHIALAGVIVLGAALRLVGISSGLPVLLYNDEAFLVQHATHISMADLNPHQFVWGSLPFYIVKLITVMAAAIVPVVSGQAADYYLVTRLFSTLCSLATLPLLDLLGRRLAGPLAGLSAALLFAVSAPMIEVSHYASIEPLATLLVGLSALGMLRWLEGDRRGRVLAAVATGLAIATKYNTAVLMVPLTITVLAVTGVPALAYERWRQRLYAAALLAGTGLITLAWTLRDTLLRIIATWTTAGVVRPIYAQLFDHILAGAAAALAAGWLLFVLAALSRQPESATPRRQAQALIRLLTGEALWVPWLLAITAFLVVSPFAVLDFPAFAQGASFDLVQQSEGKASGFSPDSRAYAAATADAISSDYLFYVNTLSFYWGLPALGLMLIGGRHLWRASRLSLLPVGLAPVLLLVLSTLGHNDGVRYLFPIWGQVALLAGTGFATCIGLLQSRLSGLRLSIIASAALAVVLCIPLKSSVELLQYRFLRPDTRLAAYDWIAQNIPPGARILRESEATTAVDTPELERITDHFHVTVAPFPFEQMTLAQWKAQGIDFMVLTDSRRQFYADHSGRFADVLSEYRRLESDGRLLRAVKPDTLQIGPAIYIYALP